MQTGLPGGYDPLRQRMMTVSRGVSPTERHALEEARQALADAITRHYDVAGLDRAVGDVVTLLEDKTGRAPSAPRREGFWR